jgi:glycosyltransferase involved in cell wall biosynthesis
LVVIPPWADDQALRPIPKARNWFAEKYQQTDRLTVMYSGNMGRGHDLETILAAAQRLQDSAKIHFMLIGAGPKWHMIQARLQQQPCANITLLPWQDEAVIPFSLAAADVGIVSLEPEMAGLAVPSKAYNFLAVGAPLLGICFASSELADTIREFDCGARIDPGDVEGLVAILQTITHDSRRLTIWREGAARARQFHSRAANTAEFLRVLRSVDLVAPVATPIHSSV